MRTNRIGRLVGVTVGVIACVLSAHTGSARVVQGFESGDPALTNSTGDHSTQTTFEGQSAPQGSNQYLLTSLIGTADQDGFTDVSGSAAVPNSSLQSFFFNNLALVGLRGSGVLIPFTVGAGDTSLTFQYDFLSNQPEQSLPKNDFAFEAIFDSLSNAVVQGGASGVRFAQVTGTSFSLFGASPFIDHTGYQTFSIDISGLAPGNYNLGIGVEALSGGSNQHDSGVLLDNVQVVPEPNTIAFSIAGASLLVAFRSRFRKSS
ncbi:MAG TPA: hypothetical protein VLK27_06585 [Chthoniobacterales bacterium]|nr:hypothetical protein [Chthoniobacterales bacterium]